MKFSIKPPMKLLRRGLFLTVTIISLNACAVAADEKPVMSQQSQPPYAEAELDATSESVQFDKIQQTLVHINNTLTATNTPSADVLISNSSMGGMGGNSAQSTLAPTSMSDSMMMQEPMSAQMPAASNNAMGMADRSSPRTQAPSSTSKGMMIMQQTMPMQPPPSTGDAMGMGANSTPLAQTLPSMSDGMQMRSMPANNASTNKRMVSCKGMMCKRKMMGMSMMGQPPAPQVDSVGAHDSLPGYTNAHHLYHLGEADFFLDHAQQLSLLPQQQKLLTAIKNSWLIQEESIDVQISEQEKVLWQATAVGQPNSLVIHNAVAEIETLNRQLRLAFIASVGKAVAVLTPAQVVVLIKSERS